MFDFVRKNTRVLQFILLILILPSFVVFGIQGYSRFTGNEGVAAQVGKQQISQQEWDNAHRNVVDRLRAEHPDADIAAFDAPEFRKQSLQALVRQYVLLQAARDQRLFVTDERLRRVFATDAQFAALRNPDGSVNKALLEARGMSAAQLEALLRQELSSAQVLFLVQATGLPSKTANRQAIDALLQGREAQWLRLDTKAYAEKLAPTEAELKAFYDDPANAAWLTAPEKADVQYVVLSLDTLKERVSISEDDLRASYEANKARYTTPEERRASHILIKASESDSAEQKQAARAKAESLLAQLRKNPSTFAEVARKQSDDPGSAEQGGDLGFVTKDAIDGALSDAIFGLKAGQVSDVVETEFGFHIVLLNAVRGGDVAPYEAVRTQLEDDARRQLAQRQFAEAAERFTNTVYEQPDTLQPVADELKLPIQAAKDVLREPGAADQGPLSNRRVLTALFDAENRAQGRNTEAIEIGPNQLISARIVKYSPAARQPFEAVQAQLRERWIAQAAKKAALADAEKKMAAWQQAPDKAELPAPVTLSRRSMFTQPAAVLDAALRAPESQLPYWRVVDLGNEGVAILKVNKVLPAEVTPQEASEAEAQFGAYWGRAEADAYYRLLLREAKVTYFNDAKKLMEGGKAAEESASDAQRN